MKLYREAVGETGDTVMLKLWGDAAGKNTTVAWRGELSAAAKPEW